jgi:holo-[acyl-carrier protein] synthase
MIVGIGVDAVDVPRMRQILARTPSFRERTFTPVERADAEQRNDPTERYAARFAAKEAVMKALGLGLGAFGLHDVETRLLESGQPVLVLHGPAATIATQHGVTHWHLTLTHTDTTAIAMVVAESRTVDARLGPDDPRPHP